MNISFKPRNSGRRCKLVQVGASWCKLVQLAMRHASALCQLQSTCLRLDAQLFATSRFLMDSNLNLTNTLEREREKDTESFKFIKYVQCCCHLNSSSIVRIEEVLLQSKSARGAKNQAKKLRCT